VNRLLLTLVQAVALLAGCHRLPPGGGGGAPLFVLEDPRGDDHGDGALRYPAARDLSPGDLDLVAFAAHAVEGGTLFEATFARPIARPERRTTDVTGKQLDEVAALGFYTLNLDVYVDRDRVPGSGRTAMLPGRKAEIDPASAWERAIVLTPRPADAAAMLRRLWSRAAGAQREERREALSEADAAALERAIDSDARDSVFFPTEVSVTGSRIRFLVPESFLGGRADPRWGYVIAVTGADLAQKVDLFALFGKDARITNLFLIPIGPGYSQESFGGGRHYDPLQPPIVDLVVPPGVRQEDVLRTKGGAPAVLPGVVPAP